MGGICLGSYLKVGFDVGSIKLSDFTYSDLITLSLISEHSLKIKIFS